MEPAGLIQGGADRAGAPLQTFAHAPDRERLTPAAIKALIRLLSAWGATNDQAAALVGMSGSTWERVRAGTWRQSLGQDQLLRASALIGIYKGLHLLFADDMADRWPGLRNSGPLFGNLSPVEAMIQGGIPVMLDVRRHIDALRGGL